MELSLDDVSVSDWSGTIRGFQPIQPIELAEFPADIAYSTNKSMKLLGDRGRLEDIALTGGKPVAARLVIRSPEADSGVYADRRTISRTLIVNTSNDFGRFGGFTLNFRVDDDAARIDNIIYAQK